MRFYALVLAVLLTAAGSAAAEPSARLLDLINAYRTERGLGALQPEARLRAAAEAHGRDMAARGYFGHDSPEGETLKERLARVGYAFRFAGENLAGGQETPHEVLEDWQKSPGHDEILLSPLAREAGLAFLPNPAGEPIERLWVLVVGRPLF
ncbi:hypothetical protein AY599_08440 [Leptolyngbya valderiana BDU 20041]|nr:hypothetical protein AY599_08440 [Leptolyngbya valderiana BDU 20041]